MTTRKTGSRATHPFALALLCGMLWTAQPALAVEGGGSTPNETKTATEKKAAKPKAKASSPKKPRATAKFVRGSEESQAERDRRLTRECKGRPNAGVCLGYAS